MCSFSPIDIAAPIAVVSINKIVTISLAPVIDWLKTYLRKTRTKVMTKTRKRNPASSFSI